MYTTIFPQAIMTDQNSSSNQIKYPEDIQIIIRSDTPSSGSLFISNLQASRNQQLLQKLKIGAIICLSKGNSIKHPSYLIKYSKYIPLEEGENVHISEYLEESTCFIDQNLRLTNVLVHCISGISKSPCFVIAYLMKNRKLTLEDAFNEVKSRRKIVSQEILQIRLDQNLISQLKHYQSLMRQRKGQQKQRMTTNQKRSNILDKSQRSKSNNLFNRSCNIHAKSLITDNMQAKEVNQSKMTQRLKASQFNDDHQSIKSYKSSKSNLNDRSQINIEVLKPIDTQNPEKSFLSKRQGLQKSILQKRNTNKSSISQKFNRNELQMQMDDLPQLTMSKKTSSSRQEYARKVMHIDNRNSELNKKIIMIQGKFEDQSILNQKKLQTELQVINELRNSLLRTQNERKIKFRQKARIDLHDKTMEDRYVQAYIQNIGNQYSITQNY